MEEEIDAIPRRTICIGDCYADNVKFIGEYSFVRLLCYRMISEIVTAFFVIKRGK